MGARIVVIEDNRANLDLMTYLLRAFGHEPLAATSGEEGLRLVVHQRPDLVLCDLQLPQMDGFEVVRHLRAEPRTSQTPAIAVTAYAMVGDRERALRAGFDGYIPKPISPESFVRQIEAFLTAGRRGPEKAMPTGTAPMTQESQKGS
jgi:CheY-like chemotaxis protein